MTDRDANSRGRYKIFLGMAAGVGKTYRMLQEGRAVADEGCDVVIGYLEPHGRAETVAQASGLEVVPRRPIVYRDAELEEMNLPALIERRPQLALVDELAHSNAPGVEHEKRYEDIRDLLDMGIDVFSTVNVQHLESLNDQVAEVTGIRVRETVPDAVLGEADEVVLMDLTPEALIQRLREGKIYQPERVEAALNNFFRIENLGALREVALRQVAQDVETKRLVQEATPSRDERLVSASVPQAVNERLLALIEPYPGAQRLVRRAWRSAQRLGAELDLLWVRAPGESLSPDNERSLNALEELASMLGAELLVEESDDIPAAVARVGETRGTTYVMMGQARTPRGLGRLRKPLPQRVMEALPGVDVRVVADRSLRSNGEAT